MKDFEAANTTVVGASYDSQAANKKFAERHDFPYPLLSDPERTLAPFGAGTKGNAKRIGVIIDTEGVVVWAGKASALTFVKKALGIVEGLSA